MPLTSFLFYLLAGLTSLSALAVVLTQHIVHSATWLLFTLAGIAGIFFLLGADFVGSIQLLVYVGGTMVLVVFGVMLTAQGPSINLRISAAEWLIAMVMGFLLLFVLALCLVIVPSSRKETQKVTPLSPHVPATQLGEVLLGFEEAIPPGQLTGIGSVIRPRVAVSYLLPFEIVSVHLLVVLIGAAYLARAKRRPGDSR